MKVEYFKSYSHNLNRDMEFKMYGEKGKLLLVFPSQNGRFYDFENNGMIDCIKDYIDQGRIRVCTCDSNDEASWSSTSWDNRKRILAQESYYHYIIDELVPFLQALTNNAPILTTGCSMGATHALNFFLRRPDIFVGVVALSGAYDATFFFPDYMDEYVYANSPVHYIEGMPYDHPYVDMYRKRDIILCCGRGAWEHPMQEDAGRMKELFSYKNIPVWVDFWGFDVAHDWPWWQKQLPYYLQYVC